MNTNIGRIYSGLRLWNVCDAAREAIVSVIEKSGDVPACNGRFQYFRNDPSRVSVEKQLRRAVMSRGERVARRRDLRIFNGQLKLGVSL